MKMKLDLVLRRLSVGAGLVLGATLAVILATRAASAPAEAAPAETGEAGIDTATPPAGLPPEKVAAYAQMVQEEVESGVQQRLWTVLSEERRGKSDAAQRAGQADLARWELGLAREFQERASAALARLQEVAKRRTEFERVNRLGPASQTETLAGLKPSLLVAEETVYLERLDQRLGILTEELGWLQETQRLYAVQLQTNNTPDDISRISWLLEDSNRIERDLQRQQSDLQLKKLEFRARRR